MKLQKLSSHGIAHFVLPLLITVLIGVIGTYVLVSSHADSVSGPNTSTYFLFSAHGKYKYAQISANNASFTKAKCGNKKLPQNSSLTLTFKQKKGSWQTLTTNCTTPVKESDGYFIAFYDKDHKPAKKPDVKEAVLISEPSNSCIFVHANDAGDSVGITHRLPREANGKCDKSKAPEDTPAPDSPAPKNSSKKSTKKTNRLGPLEGLLSLYNDGRYERASIGISTGKGVLESPVPNTDAYCIKPDGKKVVLASQPSQYTYVNLKSKAPLTLTCSASSFHVFFLKHGETYDEAYLFSRVAPSVSANYCTYVHASGITAISKVSKTGKCPTNNKLTHAAAVKKQPKLSAEYRINGVATKTIVIGKAYDQVFELKLPGNEPMSPPECAGQILISHPDLNIPARAYSIRYNAKTRTCTFLQHITAHKSGSYSPKKDDLYLVFKGNKFLKSDTTHLPINRVKK